MKKLFIFLLTITILGLVVFLIIVYYSDYFNKNFSLVIIPDSQNEHQEIVNSIVKWIIDNKNKEKIRFVLHEGDVTNNNSLSEWSSFVNSFKPLKDVVPCVVALGNHDMEIIDAKRNTTMFNKYISQINSTSLKGLFEPNKLENGYYFFSGAGKDWMIINMEFGPRQEVLSWASNLIKKHPNRTVIVLTHSYLYYDSSRIGSGDQLNPHNYISSNTNDGEEIWNKLVKKYKNISLVFSGHVFGPNQGRRMDIGNNGNQIYQILTNYQHLSNGGGGYIRLIKFYPKEKKFTVQTYSPYYSRYMIDNNNAFKYINVDFLKKDSNLINND